VEKRSRVSRSELRFTGRRTDPETGLQLNRNRFYHQQLGRWVSRDPIGYEGGSNNLYGYVAWGIDPSGLVIVEFWPNRSKSAVAQWCFANSGIRSGNFGQPAKQASGYYLIRSGESIHSSYTLTGTNVCNTIDGILNGAAKDNGGAFEVTVRSGRGDPPGKYEIFYLAEITLSQEILGTGATTGTFAKFVSPQDGIIISESLITKGPGRRVKHKVVTKRLIVDVKCRRTVIMTYNPSSRNTGAKRSMGSDTIGYFRIIQVRPITDDDE